MIIRKLRIKFTVKQLMHISHSFRWSVHGCCRKSESVRSTSIRITTQLKLFLIRIEDHTVRNTFDHTIDTEQTMEKKKTFKILLRSIASAYKLSDYDEMNIHFQSNISVERIAAIHRTTYMANGMSIFIATEWKENII